MKKTSFIDTAGAPLKTVRQTIIFVTTAHMRRDKSTEWLKQHPIFHEKEFELEDPFTVLGITELTDIQEIVKKYAKVFKYYGTFAFSASCGAGKTLAGIYLLAYFGIKTLIVSSRSAINDQWECILKKIYPDLPVKTIHSKVKDPLVYIYSPQYLIQDLSKLPIDANFIIYDEIHSIVSDSFGKCVEEPIKQYKSKRRKELPYMLALSGTYPKDCKLIRNIFGEHVPTISKITDIPVFVHDYHCLALSAIVKDILQGTSTGQVSSKKAAALKELCKNISLPITSLNNLTNEELIALDAIYQAKDDYEFIDYVLPRLGEYSIEINSAFRGYIITNTIDSSVYAGLHIANMYKINVLLMRSVDEPSYLIKPVDGELIEDDGSSTRHIFNQEYLKEHGYEKINMTKHSLMDVLDKNSVTVICGCYHRLKEGISVENAVWGICSKFIYSTIARTQILGRIRRTSNNPAVRDAKRVFIVNSTEINTNEYQLMNKAKRFHKKVDRSQLAPLYDFAYEKSVFEQENYQYA